MELRPYQREAIEALENFLIRRADNPCIVLPTGSGKSYVMAEIIRRRIVVNPQFRCIVLAHRQELIQQNHDEFVELIGVSSDNLTGVYCSGLKRRDVNAQVTFANISSVHKKAVDFPPFDMIIVDEAHHIPVRDNGMYRAFINDAQTRNPNMRIVGLTATPYRLGVGHVCHKDYVLNEVCYEANVEDLIDENWLSNLRSKISKKAPDLRGIAISGGDYKIDELSGRVCKTDLVHNTVRDALARLDAERRMFCMWFCVDVTHCKMVYDALVENGQNVEMVTGETPDDKRKDIVNRFGRGEIRHLLNVEVFTEGFNVKQVDAIVLLRPTLSRGLYSQMVGRGLRIYPNKQDCIVLDYAKCISTHGPINQKCDRFVPMEVCPQCEELFARETKKCPNCGYVVPEEVRKRHDEGDERKKRVRHMHEEIAALDEILAHDHGCGRTLRLVNQEDLVKWVLICLAKAIACNKMEFNCKKYRNLAKLPEEFIEYAQDVGLTNLPDMFRRFFELDAWHKYEKRKIRKEERRMACAHVCIFGDERDHYGETKCKHCGSFAYGRDCAVGPEKRHEHICDEKHCEWCGSSEYGRICIYSPYTVHRHGHGANKCIWCGEDKDDGHCRHSPTGRHEK